MDKDELERRFARLPVVDWSWTLPPVAKVIDIQAAREKRAAQLDASTEETDHG